MVEISYDERDLQGANIMTEELTGYFDGKTIVPDHPLKLRPGQKLRVRIESIETTAQYPLSTIGALAIDMGIENLSTDHTRMAHPGPSDGD